MKLDVRSDGHSFSVSSRDIVTVIRAKKIDYFLLNRALANPTLSSFESFEIDVSSEVELALQVLAKKLRRPDFSLYSVTICATNYSSKLEKCFFKSWV